MYKGLLIGGMLSSFCLGFSIALYINSDRVIPNIDTVQQGYIAPSALEISVEDLDGNGEDETILKFSGDKYLIMEADEMPVLFKYKE